MVIKRFFVQVTIGFCREYTKNTKSIGKVVNDKYTYVKYDKTKKNHFDYIIASDTQYGHCESMRCKKGHLIHILQMIGNLAV